MRPFHLILIALLMLSGCCRDASVVSIQYVDTVAKQHDKLSCHFEITNGLNRDIFIYDISDDFPSYAIEIMKSNVWSRIPLKGLCGTEQEQIKIQSGQSYCFNLQMPNFPMPWRLGIHYDTRKDATHIIDSFIIWTQQIEPYIETAP